MCRGGLSTLLLLRNLCFIWIFALISSCGFKALYAEKSQDVVPEMALIKVLQIPEREGQKLRNLLLSLLTPYGVAERPAYELEVKLAFSSRDLAILKDATTSRSEIVLQTHFNLRCKKTGDVILKGHHSCSADYSTLMDSPYGALVSEEGARSRLISETAEMIRLRIAAFFATSKSY